MARVLIGGCGYVGEAAATRFHEEGWQVEGWTGSAASAAKLSERPYPVSAVDVTNAEAVSKAGEAFDVVVHCVSSRGGDEEQYRRLYFEGARNLVAAFPAATLILTGSTSVYPQKDGSVVGELSPAEPPHPRGMILRETEKLVLAAGGIVARLGGIHGPDRSYFLTKFLAGAGDRTGTRFINQIHRDDAVAALLLLAQRRSGCAGQIYNVVADEPIQSRTAYEWLAARLKKEPAPGLVEPRRPRTRGESNKRVSNQKLRELGWRPRYPTFEAAMAESILPSFGF